MTLHLRQTWTTLCNGIHDPQSAPQRSLAKMICGGVTRWRELRHARRGTMRILAAFHVVKARCPSLTGEDLYAATLSQLRGFDERQARTEVRRADGGCSAGPARRALRLRDVAEYVVVSDYLARAPSAHGTLIDMAAVVGAIVPGDL